MIQKNWNSDNLCWVQSEEFQYSERIDVVGELIQKVKKEFDIKVDMETYHRIRNHKEMIKHDKELNSIAEHLECILALIEKCGK